MAHVPYGTFNPRFYGISLVHDPQQLDVLERYHGSSIDDWVKGAQASEIGHISALSAVEHEVRHLHDFLIATVGTTTMGMRMQASINGVQAMKAISRCSGTFVPVPLMQWVSWDLGQRERWIQSTGKYFGVARLEDIVPLPGPDALNRMDETPGFRKLDVSAPPESLASTYLLGAISAYRGMHEARQPRDWGLDLEVAADDVFEGSAHLVQNQAIWMGQGETAAAHYQNFLMTSEATYLRPLQILTMAFRQKGVTPALQRFVELFVWMLLGPYKDPRHLGNPALRLTQVLTLAVTAPAQVLTGPYDGPADLWDELDRLTGSASWRANLQAAETAADRRKQFYLDMTKHLRGGYFDALFSVADHWHEDQRLARDRLRQDPASYADPRRYLSERAFPTPNFEFTLASHIHERGDVLALPGASATAVDAEGKQVLSYIKCGAEPIDPAYADHLRGTRTISHLVDYLFLDEPAVTLFEQYWRLKLEDFVKKKVISVF